MSDNTRDLHEPRARRYARALATAAAAEKRISELTEKLTEHEWHRTEAEGQVDYLRERLDLGGQQIIAGTDDAPSEEVAALLCLRTGRAWTRLKHHDGTVNPHCWVKAAASERGQIQHEWPIEDAGPFLVLPYEWDFSEVNREARKRDEQVDRIHERIRRLDAYPRETWMRPDLDVAVIAVIDDLEKRNAETSREAYRLREELDAVKRELATYKTESEAS